MAMGVGNWMFGLKCLSFCKYKFSVFIALFKCFWTTLVMVELPFLWIKLASCFLWLRLFYSFVLVNLFHLFVCKKFRVHQTMHSYSVVITNAETYHVWYTLSMGKGDDVIGEGFRWCNHDMAPTYKSWRSWHNLALHCSFLICSTLCFARIRHLIKKMHTSYLSKNQYIHMMSLQFQRVSMA